MLKSTHRILLEEVKKIRKRLSKEITKELSQSYETGGQWHDNPQWDYMLQDQQRLAEKLRKILSALRSVALIDDLPVKGDRVTIGVEIQVEDETGQKESYKIVGSLDMEYNFLCRKKGFISYQAPLARQLMGKSLDEEITVMLPVKKRRLIILAIRPLH
ncbi:MAG: GreA/GreB family elongation factor [Patescibacteria group bacterium]